MWSMYVHSGRNQTQAVLSNFTQNCTLLSNIPNDFQQANGRRVVAYEENPKFDCRFLSQFTNGSSKIVIIGPA